MNVVFKGLIFGVFTWVFANGAFADLWIQDLQCPVGVSEIETHFGKIADHIPKLEADLVEKLVEEFKPHARYSSINQGSLFQALTNPPSGKEILVLGPRSSRYQEIAAGVGASSFNNIQGSFFSEEVKQRITSHFNAVRSYYDQLNSPYRKLGAEIGIKMILNAREIHFYLGQLYPELQHPQARVQKMLDEEGQYLRRETYSEKVTNWEMWFIHCSVFSPLLKMKLVYHDFPDPGLLSLVN